MGSQAERRTTDWHWQWGGFPQVAEQVENGAVLCGAVRAGPGQWPSEGLS